MSEEQQNEETVTASEPVASRPATDGAEAAPSETGDRPGAGERGPAADRRGPGGRGRGRFASRRRACQFCVDKVEDIDYKDAPRLRRYVSERGKIEPRRKTSTCARHQRKLTEALKRARHLALLPYSAEHVRTTGFFPPRG